MEKGVSITGIQARIGEVKSFAIACRPFLEVDNIWLEAECIWMQAGKKSGDWYSRFK